MSFDENLKFGVEGEETVSQWIRSRGRTVIPIYEKEGNDFKGPRVFTVSGDLVAPDLMVLDLSKFSFVEVKHKTVFSWHRISQRWVTGIDIRHWDDYCKIAQLHPVPFWILFLHRRSQTAEGDGSSPTGLFGNSIENLAQNYSHSSNRWGRYGMRYWALEHLKKIATLEEICPQLIS